MGCEFNMYNYNTIIRAPTDTVLVSPDYYIGCCSCRYSYLADWFVFSSSFLLFSYKSNASLIIGVAGLFGNSKECLIALAKTSINDCSSVFTLQVLSSIVPEAGFSVP